jgi:hypothetical protein
MELWLWEYFWVEIQILSCLLSSDFRTNVTTQLTTAAFSSTVRPSIETATWGVALRWAGVNATFVYPKVCAVHNTAA